MVKQAAFVTSAVRPSQFPAPDRPEVAFAGRSNVGKSSLLNRLLQRKSLARTSNTPGRTQLINFFDVNGDLYLVDLPGYGYANVPVSVRKSWQPMVEGYLTAPRDLRLVILLVDIRREPQIEEANLIHYLHANGLPYLVVTTKADKVSRGQRSGRLAAIGKALELNAPPLGFSALTGEGREAILAEIVQACGLDGSETGEAAEI